MYIACSVADAFSNPEPGSGSVSRPGSVSTVTSSPLEKCRPGNEKPPCWCRNILPHAYTDILHSSMLGISSGIWRRTFSVMLQENSARASNYKC